MCRPLVSGGAGKSQVIGPDGAAFLGKSVVQLGLLCSRLSSVAVPQLGEPYLTRNQLFLDRRGDVALEIASGRDGIRLGRRKFSGFGRIEGVPPVVEPRADDLPFVVHLGHPALQLRIEEYGPAIGRRVEPVGPIGQTGGSPLPRDGV